MWERGEPVRAPRFSSGASRCDLRLHLVPGLARLVDGALILDRGDVAWVPVQDHGLQDTPHDLAGARLRQHAHEVQIADDGDGTELAAHGVEQLAPHRVGWRSALLEHDERGDDLTA